MAPFKENRGLKPSQMDMGTFLDTFGGVYERSTWIAKDVFMSSLRTDHDTIAGLHSALQNVVDQADHNKQLGLLRAHPDLAGKLAIAGKLTKESIVEQESAQLDQCTASEFREFRSLNDRFKTTFGHPYILAVRNRNRKEILSNYRTRLNNDPHKEFAEALKQVHQIAL